MDSKEGVEGPVSDYPSNKCTDGPEDTHTTGAGPTHSYTLQDREEAARNNVANPSLDFSCERAYIFGV
jgi:hypothetical protein